MRDDQVGYFLVGFVITGSVLALGFYGAVATWWDRRRKRTEGGDK